MKEKRRRKDQTIVKEGESDYGERIGGGLGGRHGEEEEEGEEVMAYL